MNKRIRKKKGLSKIKDSDCWNLNSTIINFILPRLQKFKIINTNSYPSKCGSLKKWHEIVNKIIWSFQFAKDKNDYNYSLEYRRDKTNWNKYYEGMDLFKEYLFDLWD
jgi:hypothetical protein